MQTNDNCFLNKTSKTFPTIRTIPKARANLACFTSDRVSKHNANMSNMSSTWAFNQGNSSLLFYQSLYRRAGRYPSILKPISADNIVHPYFLYTFSFFKFLFLLVTVCAMTEKLGALTSKFFNSESVNYI